MAAICISRYLKGSLGKKVIYRATGKMVIESFSNADWGGSPSYGRSTLGYCNLFGGNLVTWESTKQGVRGRSSAEPKYGATVRSL